jgi:hypothetical protein
MTVFTIRYGNNQVMVIEERDPDIAERIHYHLCANYKPGLYQFGVSYYV